MIKITGKNGKKNCEIAIKTTQEELKTDYEAIDLMTKDKELPYKKICLYNC